MKKQILLVVSIILLGFSMILAQTPKTISGGVLNGKSRSLPIPEYPAAAMAVRASGTVNVQVMIDENGDVVSASAVSGHPLLRSAAEDAARQAKFSPTTLSGQAVKVTGIIVYNFTPAISSDPAQPMTQTSDQKTRIESMGSGYIVSNSPLDKAGISGGILNGKASHLAIPSYPAAAKAVNAEGAVNVQVTIDENGDVISASAISGHPLLRAAAETAARDSKFIPTLLSGQAVKVTGIIVYNFTTGNSTVGNYNWFKVGFDLANVQSAPSLVFLNTNSIDKIFQNDWISEKEQLQKLAEIKQAEVPNRSSSNVINERKISENTEKTSDGATVKTVIVERAVNSDNQPTGEQIAISQSLLSSLQSRLGSDQLKLWQLNTGASLSQALSKLRFTNERQRVLDSLRQQIQSAPSGISPEYLNDLQSIMGLVEIQTPTTEDRMQVVQIMQRLFTY